MALFDTTFIIDLMKDAKTRRHGPATQELDDLLRRGELMRVPIFTLAELYVGVIKGTQPERESQAIERCMAAFEVLHFEESTAKVFGSVVGELEKRGQVISDMDALIASVALEHDELLVTRNIKHFSRVPGLRVEGYRV